MSHKAILTDSNENLQPGKTEKQYLHVVPLTIHGGKETLYDGIDITPTDFYIRLRKNHTSPTTSQPSPQNFLKKFEELSFGNDGIIVTLISSRLSGTVNSAKIAACQFKQIPVEFIDTHSTSAGLALVIEAAARSVEDGCALEEGKQAALSVAQQFHLFFAVDSLNTCIAVNVSGEQLVFGVQ